MKTSTVRATLAASVAGLLLAISPAPSHAAGPPARGDRVGMAVLDAVVVRPLSLVGSVAGSAVFAATLPLSFFTGVAPEASTYLVVAPWRFTVARFLGDFHGYKDGRTVTGRLVPRPR